MKDKGLLEPRGILSLSLCVCLDLSRFSLYVSSSYSNRLIWASTCNYCPAHAHDEFKAQWDSFIIDLPIDMEVSTEAMRSRS